MEALADSVELVVAELVTNAMQASAGLTGSQFAGRWAPGLPPVRMWLASDGEHAVIQVWDASDRPPVRETVPLDAETGRGLLIVESLADEWGSYTPEASSGKVVWAVISDGQTLPVPARLRARDRRRRLASAENHRDPAESQ
jgi:two-component sensor histidine kinase